MYETNETYICGRHHGDSVETEKKLQQNLNILNEVLKHENKHEQKKNDDYKIKR